MDDRQTNEIVQQLVLANRILAHEGVLDAFGHVSARHPTRPDRYFISRAISPEQVTAADILELTLEGEPLADTGARLYGERPIHGCLYALRADVVAIAHTHSPAILPFAISGTPIVPVFHIGSVLGASTPFWDFRDGFGDTNLLVHTQEQGRSLAKAMGVGDVVLMRRHGGVIAGRSVPEMVFRSIALHQNAELQYRAQMLGGVSSLSESEIAKAGSFLTQMPPIMRAWNYWCNRLPFSADAMGIAGASA